MSEFLKMIVETGLIGQLENQTAYTIAAFSIVFASYLIGSVNFCRIASKKLGIDNLPYLIVEKCGKKIFLYYFLDWLKGFVCSALGFVLMPGAGFSCLAMLFCILGHGLPVFFGFKVKGDAGALATLFGCSIIINPIISMGAFFIALALYFGFRYISLSGLVYIVLFAFVNDRLMIWKFESIPGNFVSTINTVLSYGAPFIAMLIAVLVYANGFARLVRGKEEKTYFNSQKKD